MEKSLFRKILNLAIVLLIVHAGWKITPVFLRHFRFTDRITEAARYSGNHNAKELQKQILDIAGSEQVPLDPKSLAVDKTARRVHIDAKYTEKLEFLPRYYYPHEFVISIDTTLARPMTPGEIR